MIVYHMLGEFVMKNNEIRYATTNWLTRIGLNSAYLETVTIAGNIFGGRDSYVTCTLGLLNLDSTTYVNIYNNQFYNLAPSTISFGNVTSSDVHVNLEYNYFDSLQQVKIRFGNGANIVHNHNCYAGGLATRTSDDNWDLSADAVTYDTLKDVQDAFALSEYPKE